MSIDHLRILIGGLAIVVGGFVLYIDLADGGELNAATVGAASAFTTAAVAFGGKQR